MFFLYAFCKGAFLLYRNPGITVVLGGSALAAPLVVILGRLFRKKVVVQVHGLDVVYPNLLYRALCVRWLRFCDRVIANSRYTASLAEEKGAPPGSVSVIPPGVNWESFVSSESPDVIKKTLGLEGRKIILFVGRLARRKGVKEFIRKSLADIVEAAPEACFVIVGQNPTESLAHREDMSSEIRLAVAEAGLDTKVRMLGRLDDRELAQVYQICDLVVLPALPVENDVEGFGIVLLEAAAAGKPVIATRVGGIPDAVKDGTSGVLVEPGDYGSMSRAIVRLLHDDALRQSMGQYAQRRVREQFSWPSIVARYEETLSSLAEDSHWPEA